MPKPTILTFALMDPPFESARTTTGLRIIQAALEQRHSVKVFAYEGAVALSFSRQTAHANAVHGKDAAQENHPLPRQWIEELLQIASSCGAELEWINCGLCVDERGVNETIAGVKRGSPADFWRMVQQAHNTLVIPTR